ncbi:nop14-like family protein [Zalerion maritima]|uniref:Nop14-like family protein n=1 Tax=Zalerion maritima TaxID=339359 RepID=A0AAD5RXF3_9PEZI|nr:nop14-like family protein [Zalerion maritima]
MPPSQLKRLKASLRDQGVIGPQQSKRQKKKEAQNGKNNNRKSVVVEQIREQFNPFDVKRNPRGPKFEVATSRPTDYNAVKGRPGAARAAGEDKRRETLLVEMQRRNKVGGIIDRRFGETDPDMSNEDKILERFTREKQRLFKKHSVFDLNEGLLEDEPTPFGSSLRDDFDEQDMQDAYGKYDDDGNEGYVGMRVKRSHGDMASLHSGDGDHGTAKGEPMRKKTKTEVMKEAIAKSKLYKYERQATKEENEGMREELDAGFSALNRLLKTTTKGPQNNTKPKSEVLEDAIKKFIPSQHTMSQQMLGKAALSGPTKSKEEVEEEAAAKLLEIEDKKLRRMRGEQISEDSEDSEKDEEEEKPSNPNVPFWMQKEEEQDAFGLGGGNRIKPTPAELGFDDEDDFIIDDNLVGSDSEMAPITNGEDLEDDEDEDESASTEEREDEFDAEDVESARFDNRDNTKLASLPCPQTHDQLLGVLKGLPSESLQNIIRNIRTQHHPRLAKINKELLAQFARVLVQHISYVGNSSNSNHNDARLSASFVATEVTIRHVHSMGKNFPVDVANKFRDSIKEMSRERPLSLTVGDLCILTAVGSIFPTSDHFHQVATPAMLVISRYLGQKILQSLPDYAKGIFLSSLAYQYQSFSKRYVPEALNFCLNTLSSLAPSPLLPAHGRQYFPIHEPSPGIRIAQAGKSSIAPRKLQVSDCLPPSPSSSPSTSDSTTLKISLMETTIHLLTTFSTLWSAQPAYIETFAPARSVLSHLQSKNCRAHLPASLATTISSSLESLDASLANSQRDRHPLELHHHKPLAVKSHIPKFEETYDPEKHYDPDQDRAEARKLAKEYRKERKGAMRELRRDAHFMAREKLKTKIAKDTVYDKKFKRLVAEIQGEEGREAKEYEREKDRRKKLRG